jgi:nucleoside-diphosphate-sugar epimerase
MGETEAFPSRPLVLVTGSGGLIGTRVVRDLSRDHLVVGIDRDPPRPGEEGEWIQCDLTRDDSVAEALGDVAVRFGRRVASVIHLAAYYDFSGDPSPMYERLTVEGTRRLLRELRRRAFEAEQFVFSSSLLVHRAVEPGGLIDEDSPLLPEWEYPRSKVEAEQVIADERGPIPAVILRIAGVYDEDGNSLPIGQQIRRIHGKSLESFFFPGDADRGQPFVHLDDLVRLIRACVERRGALGPLEVFLVGEPEVVTYRDLQELIGEALWGREWPTIRIPRALAKAGAWIKDKAPGADDPFIKPWMIDLADAHRPISIERARRGLGWEPRSRLRDVLPEMVRRMLADPAAWYDRNGLEPPRGIAGEPDEGASPESGS